VSLACHPLDVLRSHIVAAHCPSTRIPSVFPIGAAAPTASRAAGLLFWLRSEQHAVMPIGGLLFLRSPVVVVVHPGEATSILVRFRIGIIFL
jgi:hypothetical protein